MPNLTVSELITIATLLATLINWFTQLRVRADVSDLKAEIAKDVSGVNEKIANMNATFVERLSSLYQTIMGSVNNSFITRSESQAWHEANTKRLDTIEHDLRDVRDFMERGRN